MQFAAEATLLAGGGGVAGAVLGGFSTTVYAAARHWDAVVPVPVLLAAVAVALLVGAGAGLYPALRAARLVLAQALRLGDNLLARGQRIRGEGLEEVTWLTVRTTRRSWPPAAATAAYRLSHSDRALS